MARRKVPEWCVTTREVDGRGAVLIGIIAWCPNRNAAEIVADALRAHDSVRTYFVERI